MSTTTTEEERPAPVADPLPSPSSDEPGTGLTFEAIAVIALVIAFAAVITSVFAIGIAARSIDEHRAIAEGGAGGGPVAVSLEEFAINPGPVSATAGATISVTNDGTTTHDLTVEGQDLATPTLDAGGTAELDVGTLAPGTYTLFCSIPGHRESGMETDLTVG